MLVAKRKSGSHVPHQHLTCFCYAASVRQTWFRCASHVSHDLIDLFEKAWRMSRYTCGLIDLVSRASAVVNGGGEWIWRSEGLARLLVRVRGMHACRTYDQPFTDTTEFLSSII